MAKKSTEEILKEISKLNKITEPQMKLLLMRKNAGEKFDDSIFWDGEIELTQDQVAKGKKYLLNLYKSPTGKERSNNPFGYREQVILEQMTGITLRGFHDAGNFFRSFYVPLYKVDSPNNSMEYYVSGGKINIIG